jgi:hypothetical protein
MLATGSIAASATTTPAPTSPPSSSECNFGQHLVHVWLHLPPKLKDDVKDLKDVDPGKRDEAVREIRDKARQGEYGPEVQKRAERIHEHRLEVYSTLPAALKTDLKELRKADPADRKALAEAIAKKALDGGYGEKVQKNAKRIQSSPFWQNCVAK